MFSFSWNFRERAEAETTQCTILIFRRSDHRQEASCSGSRFVSTAPSSYFGKKLLGRCLVAATLAAMKRLIYYSSITQRERSYFRQLNFCSVRLECSQALHYMLTNHFFMLSKPGHPRKVCTAKIVKRYCITISEVRTRSGGR